MAGFQSGLSLDPLDAPQRHCFYDSDDEEDEGKGGKIPPEDSFFVEGSFSRAPRLLVIGTSPVACTFLSTHVDIDHSNPCSVVKTRCPLKVLQGKYFSHDGSSGEEQQNQGDADNESIVVSEIYPVKGTDSNSFICLNQETFKDEYCNYWSRTVLKHVNPQRIVVLHSLPLHCYFGYDFEVDDNVSHRLKGLVTSSWTMDPLIDFLSPSNVISGEPSSVMTHCQVSGIPAALSVLYLSSTALTLKEQLDCFKPLLSHSLFKSSLNLQSLKETEKVLGSFLPKDRHDLNVLYT